MINCTVGVMAYNEEHNIVSTLHALLNQRVHTGQITEIIVIASGCTDRTVERAREVALAYPLITIEAQCDRAGKAAAINHLIKIARSDVIVLVGADTLPDPTALEHLVQPFTDPMVGMTGARVVPLNDLRTFLGFTTHILWRVHHRMAMRWPKLGELVAFRNVVTALPLNSATDEVALEALVSAQGYRLVYVPDAVVYNRGPETLDEFLWQRRRIFAGHLHIASIYGYVAASMRPSHLLVLAAEAFSRYSFLLPLLSGAVLVELWARWLGTLDFYFGRSHHIWQPAISTKQVQPRAQPLTLVVFQCRSGSVKPDQLIRAMRSIPASQGLLFWWYQRRSQVLFIVPAGASSRGTLEDRVSALATHLTSRQSQGTSAVLSYRVVQFLASSAPPDANNPPDSRLWLAPAA